MIISNDNCTGVKMTICEFTSNEINYFIPSSNICTGR